MYRSEAIQALFGRVGFRNTTEAEYAGLITAPNTESRSGRYFDEFHRIITVPNLKDVANYDPAISDANFNTLLIQWQKSAIAAVLGGVLSKAELIEQQMIYERDYEDPEVLQNTGKFVGYMVQVANRTNLVVRPKALSLFFDAAGTFNIYVFNHLKKAPIKTITVTTVADEEVIVPITDVVLTAIGSASKSRTYFIGYFQDDIEALNIKALDYGMHLKREGICYSADGIEANTVSATDFNRYNPPFTGRTYGLNIELTSSRDYTEVILQNEQLFDKAIGLQMAAFIVESIIHSTRSNKDQRIGAEGVKQLYTDLNLRFSTPEFPYTTGIKNQLERECGRVFRNLFPKDKIKTTTTPADQCYLLRRPL
jgi:hypothetical protein